MAQGMQGLDPQALERLMNSTPEEREQKAAELASQLPPPPPGALEQMAMELGAGASAPAGVGMQGQAPATAGVQAPGPTAPAQAQAPAQTQIPQVPGNMQGSPRQSSFAPQGTGMPSAGNTLEMQRPIPQARQNPYLGGQ